MTPQPIILDTADRTPALNVIGVDVTVLAANTTTGAYEITVQKGAEGMGPPPHSHDWDESFYVLSGSVEMVCDGHAVLCQPGSLVHVPGGTVHAFQFGPGGGEMLEITGAGGRATQMFTDIANTVDAQSPDMGKVVAALQNNGVTVHM